MVLLRYVRSGAATKANSHLAQAKLSGGGLWLNGFTPFAGPRFGSVVASPAR